MCDAGEKLQKVVDGYQNMGEQNGALDSDFAQKGGGVGYILDIEKPLMGGKPAVLGYESAPQYKDGSLVDQRSETGMLMGHPDQCGGYKKKGKLSNKKHNNNNHPKMNNNGRNNNVRVNVKVNSNNKKSKKKSQSKKGKGRKYSHKKHRAGKKHNKMHKGKYYGKKSHKKGKGKGRYYRKNRSKNRRRFKKGGQKMKGGSGCQYTRLEDGQEGVFTADMSQRTFEGKQPNWQPSDV